MYRLRIIAGPNGSGKTTLTKDLQKNFHFNFGYYINADEIESILKANKKISFKRYHLKISPEVFNSYFASHALYASCKDAHFTVSRNTIYLDTELKTFSYFTALLADFLRFKILESKQTFTFETVMSGKDKLLFLNEAKQHNYRIYLYYIATDSVLINEERVADRVEKGGHAVPGEKIRKRYYRSLENLLDAIKLVNRAYLFDNSDETHKLVAEINEGKEVHFDPSFVPYWLEEYVLNKLR